LLHGIGTFLAAGIEPDHRLFWLVHGLASEHGS
jgi:hypothetical protein